MINTEQVTKNLRPPKKPAGKALGKYFRKVETDYNNTLGVTFAGLNVDGRYVTCGLIASFKDSTHLAFALSAMTFFMCLFVVQVVTLLAHGQWILFEPGYDIAIQLVLTIYAFIQFKKSKKKQAVAVVFDRKTGNVNFPAFGRAPELVIPFEQVEIYLGSIAYSRGSGMPIDYLIPKMYPESAKRDYQYGVGFADSYDQACAMWALLTEFMDKNKPIPYGMLASIQYHIDENEGTIWPGTDVFNPYPLDPEIKDNYPYVFHTNYEKTVEYPREKIQYVIAPFSDNPELLKQNIERAYDLYLLIMR